MSEEAPPRRAAPRRPGLGPSEVARGVFVGGMPDAAGFSGLRICVRDDRPSEMDAWPDAHHFPIYDGQVDGPILDNLDQVAELVEDAHRAGRPVLIFCGHGIRRGPLAAAWYLHRSEGLPLSRAFEAVAAVRPGIERPGEWMQGWRALERPPPRRPRRRSSDA